MEKQKNSSIVPFPDRSEILALVFGALPFSFHLSTASVTTLNGRVVWSVTTDYVALAGGVLCILFALPTLRLQRRTADEDRWKRRTLFVGLLVLAAVQIMRGVGIF